MTNRQDPSAHRAGAMTMAMNAVALAKSAPRHLRIAIVRDGCIVDERTFASRRAIYIGANEGNDFVVGDAAQRFCLFEYDDGRLMLNFEAQMNGRVALAHGTKTFEELRDAGATLRATDGCFQVLLHDAARGKVTVGDTTFLFQRVVPIAAQSRPRLPTKTRNAFAASIDWVFSSLVMSSFAAHFGFIVYLENADWPLSTGIADMSPAVARLVFDESAEPPAPLPVPERVADARDTPTPTSTPEPSSTSRPTRDHVATSSTPTLGPRVTRTDADAEGARISAEEAIRQAQIMLIGALDAQSGSFVDMLNQGRALGAAADVMADVQSVGIASNDHPGQIRDRVRTSDVELSTLGRLNVVPATTAASAEPATVTEIAIRNSFQLGRAELPEPSDDPNFNLDNVVRRIRANQGAFKACHELVLRHAPDVAGKVEIEFTISTTGNVARLEVVENTTGSEELAGCISARIQALRITPPPQNGTVTVSFPFVFSIQN